MLQYHARTFDLLGTQPGVSPSALELLDQLEKRISRPLPASVREWYQLSGACEILLQ